MDLSTAETIFELKGGYSEREVKAAYKRLALKHHPDQNEGSPASNYFMRQINEAYELLMEAVGDGGRCGAQRAGGAGYDAERAEREAAERKRRERERWERECRERARRQAAEQERRAREEASMTEDEYLRACELAQSASTVSEHLIVASLFEALGNYRDSESFAAYHRAAAEKRRKRARRLNACSSLTMLVAPIAYMAIATVETGPIWGLLACLVCGAWAPVALGAFGTGERREEPSRLAGVVAMAYAVAAVPYTLFIPAGRLALVVIAAGQLVGGASWCVTPTGKAKTGIKIALACVGYAAVLAGVCMFALGLA